MKKRRVTEREIDGGGQRQSGGQRHKGSTLKIVSFRDWTHNEDDRLYSVYIKGARR